MAPVRGDGGRGADEVDRGTRDGVPSTRGYRLAGLVLGLAIVAAVGWWLWSLTVNTRAVNEFTTLPPVSGMPVEVEAAGAHVIWAGSGCGGYCAPEAPELYRVHLTVGLIGPDGPLALEPYAGDTRYSLGAGRQGRAVWAVDVPQPGTYLLERRSDGEIRSPPLLLGAGTGLPTDTWGGIRLILIGGTLVAAGLTAVTYQRRRTALARLDATRRR